MFSIDAIMTTDLITIAPSSTLAEARALLQEHRIHHLPVVDADHTLVGLMTLTDVLAASDSSLRDEGSRIRAANINISEVMVTDIATVDENASLRQAALFLEKHKIGCLPVVSNGTLKGIITDSDFVAVAINLLEQLESSEPDDFDEAGAA
ncbi:MAG: CBS domain-containing protein [Woeseiaceae bacterium]|nr:CBS domain-containing protein [Woeseiaceae bacterium]